MQNTNNSKKQINKSNIFTPIAISTKLYTSCEFHINKKLSFCNCNTLIGDGDHTPVPIHA